MSDSDNSQGGGLFKVIVAVVLIGAIAAWLHLSSREQAARSASQAAHQVLDQVIADESTLTAAEVHQKLEKEPDQVRQIDKHKMVEEYVWKGPLQEYRVYAYYVTAATQLLTAVSINQEHPDWQKKE